MSEILSEKQLKDADVCNSRDVSGRCSCCSWQGVGGCELPYNTYRIIKTALAYRNMIIHLLYSADSSWENGNYGGHDWSEATNKARNLLRED